MKKFIIAALAASSILSPLAATGASAQQRDERRTTVIRQQPNGRTVVTERRVVRPQQNRRWARGQRFDRRYASNYQEIGNWQQYRGRRLYAPPRGYHWVRSGNDAVLVALSGGLIGAVLGGAFN
ncbi:RcnB family protein [Sphingomonas sp. PAMC 26605]|uniref:RcnB family protein n=1 Tax=Sphingomonas sp. PAMC 26605 TaxID=1112214 RepID=UPI00026CCBD2|nr:RcnB family protein [Sphingomonas sp. PAMC 26605]